MSNEINESRMIVIPQLIRQIMQTDPLMDTLRITAIGQCPQSEFRHIERTTPIAQYVFVYCLEGKGWYKVGKKKVIAESGHYFVLPANEPHSYGSSKDNPWSILWFHFEGTSAAYYVQKASELQSAIEAKSFLRFFKEIYSAISHSYALDSLSYASSLLHHLFGQICFKAASTSNDNSIETVIHYLQDNLDQVVTLNELASHTGYSPCYLSTLFKQKTGHAPLVYFNILKIQKACQLIDTTDMQINQVSHMVGIQDPYYFSRLFTKIVGVSPINYRNMVKG